MIQKKFLIYSIVALISICTILLWIVSQLASSHREYHKAVAIESSRSAGDQIQRFIEERERLVVLFANTYRDSIYQVVLDPMNAQLKYALAAEIANFFPDYYAYTIADNQGAPYIANIDGVISDMCISDLASYSQLSLYRQMIHPNPATYHFDVMAKFTQGELNAILFISFKAELLGKILGTTETKGHQAMLVEPGQEDLIEVFSSGARNVVARDDYRLSVSEQQRILARVSIEGTRWQAIDLIDRNLFSDYQLQLYIESLILLVIITVILTLLFSRFRHEALRRIEAEKQQEDFMRVVAHELRTPAASIAGALSLIRDGLAGTVSSEVKNLLQVCSRNTQHLMTLVDDFLDYHSMESGMFKLDKKLVCVNDLVSTAISNSQHFVATVGSKIVFLPCDEEITSIIDGKRIQQVLTNLLSNAAKYGAKNDTIEVELFEDSGSIVIGVTDHGEGVPMSIQRKLFSPYVMFDTENESSVASTGLGLSIVKSIVEAHGGHVGFTSDQKIGSRFYFSLPTA